MSQQLVTQLGVRGNLFLSIDVDIFSFIFS